jgi:hypothetical protein
VSVSFSKKCSRVLLELSTCKFHRNLCRSPKIIKLILLDSCVVDLHGKNVVLHVNVL